MLQRPGNPYSGKGIRIRKFGIIRLNQEKKEKIIKLKMLGRERKKLIVRLLKINEKPIYILL